MAHPFSSRMGNPRIPGKSGVLGAISVPSLNYIKDNNRNSFSYETTKMWTEVFVSFWLVGTKISTGVFFLMNSQNHTAIDVIKGIISPSYPHLKCRVGFRFSRYRSESIVWKGFGITLNSCDLRRKMSIFYEQCLVYGDLLGLHVSPPKTNLFIRGKL